MPIAASIAISGREVTMAAIARTENIASPDTVQDFDPLPLRDIRRIIIRGQIVRGGEIRFVPDEVSGNCQPDRNTDSGRTTGTGRDGGTRVDGIDPGFVFGFQPHVSGTLHDAPIHIGV